MKERNPDKGDSCSMIDKDGNESNMALHLQMCELDEEGELANILLVRESVKDQLSQEDIDLLYPLPEKK